MAPTQRGATVLPGTDPYRLEPMLAATAAEPFDDPEKIFEVKWDGIRAIAVVEDGRVHLHTRGLKDISVAFADVGDALLAGVGARSVVLDGELVALDEAGMPKLHRVMERWHQGALSRKPIPVSFEVFDILALNGDSLLRKPLYQRKALLHDTLEPNDIVHLCHFEDGEGITLFEASRSLGLEGVVAKSKGSKYEPGRRSPNWVKVKHARSANLVVAGYTFGGGTRKELFGSLLLGAYDGGHLVYAGSVGGGFSNDDLAVTYEAVRQLHTDVCPFVEPPKVDRFLYWCQPALVAQVRFGEWTKDRHLRFPIFTALRPDVAPFECTVAAIEAEL